MRPGTSISGTFSWIRPTPPFGCVWRTNLPRPVIRLGAMQFIETGLEVDPENVDLLKQHGGFAFTAGAEINQGQAEMPPEAAELFRKAQDSYGKVYAIQGADMDMGLLRNMVIAHINLGEFAEAVELGARILETHGDEAAIWSIYADALQRAGRVDDAIAALNRVKGLDNRVSERIGPPGELAPPGGSHRRGDPGTPGCCRRGASNRSTQLRTSSSTTRTRRASSPRIGPMPSVSSGWPRSSTPPSLTGQKLDFWLGYSLFQSSRVQQEPNTLETAQATLPRFQEVLRLMQGSGDYAQRNNFEKNRQDVITATNTMIEIQEAIIKRGR